MGDGSPTELGEGTGQRSTKSANRQADKPSKTKVCRAFSRTLSVVCEYCESVELFFRPLSRHTFAVLFRRPCEY
uniref:Uncharacterized protein n=1 Tax=Plectus sambesii TaxID=2011161 RepID=A0A914URZ5_9BILA